MAAAPTAADGDDVRQPGRREDRHRAAPDVLGRPGGGPVAQIIGQPGVGKSALALVCAHQVADRFPGGQLYFRFDSDAGQRTEPVETALRSALEALRVDRHLLPVDLKGLIDRYRTATAQRSILVVIDGASQPAQVTPLIPASPHSAVLVTARRPFGALSADGAVTVTLGPLEETEAVRLLSLIAGEPRVAAQPEAAARLVGLCGGLPVAVRIAAAQLAEHPHWPLSRLVTALETPGQRLVTLSDPFGESVAAVFDEAVRALDDETARAYRLLGLHPGTSFTASSAAPLLDRPEAAAGLLLDRLAAMHLCSGEADRFRFNSLVHEHARALAAQREEGASRLAAGRRVLAWYVRAAYRADWAALGERLRIAGPATSADAAQAGPGPDLPTAAAALAWLETERVNLLAAQELAVEIGEDAAAWQLTEAMQALFTSRPNLADETSACRVGAEAARRAGDRLAEAQMLKMWAAAHRRAGDSAAAEARVEQALSVLPAAGANRLAASLWEEAGKLRLLREDLPAARVLFERAKAVNAESGWERGRLLQEVMLGQVLRREGRLDESLAVLLAAETGLAAYNKRNRARAAVQVARTANALGELPLACGRFEAAAALYRERGERGGQAEALEGLADSAIRLGDQARSRAALEELLGLARSGLRHAGGRTCARADPGVGRHAVNSTCADHDPKSSCAGSKAPPGSAPHRRSYTREAASAGSPRRTRARVQRPSMVVTSQYSPSIRAATRAPGYASSSGLRSPAPASGARVYTTAACRRSRRCGCSTSTATWCARSAIGVRAVANTSGVRATCTGAPLSNC